MESVCLECPDCGGSRLRVLAEDYEYRCACPDCGGEWVDAFEDVHGPMSVPGGFAL